MRLVNEDDRNAEAGFGTQVGLELVSPVDCLPHIGLKIWIDHSEAVFEERIHLARVIEHAFPNLERARVDALQLRHLFLERHSPEEIAEPGIKWLIRIAVWRRSFLCKGQSGKKPKACNEKACGAVIERCHRSMDSARV